ncbi:MAG: hypothetical protein Sylvanvirus18_17 [Sylvanvirus sp.]|uniref:Uncharacterized protein n=1 Tax=Sylvanvirus sp. TaxID=2487774 RepID=A0A3G5AJP2_9VIRU|nr:MAG: hypothetical protein Sylvanvirus18_17 [Sylvanvirus sp.]
MSIDTIIALLNSIPTEWIYARIFTTGVDDTNKTEFELKATELDIGVLSHSEREGRILLFLLQSIMEKCSITRALKDECTDLKSIVEIEEAIKQDYIQDFVTIFEQHELITVELSGWCKRGCIPPGGVEHFPFGRTRDNDSGVTHFKRIIMKLSHEMDLYDKDRVLQLIRDFETRHQAEDDEVSSDEQDES